MVEKSLRNQIIGAIEDVYIEVLKEHYIGYNNQNIPNVFAHLFDNYCTITNQDISRNNSTLLEP